MALRNKKPTHACKEIKRIWSLEISEEEMRAILAVTQGGSRFAVQRMGEEEADDKRMKLMFDAAKKGKILIQYTTSVPSKEQNLPQDGAHVYFYFTPGYRDDTGESWEGYHFISFLDQAIVEFDAVKRQGLQLPPIPAGVTTAGKTKMGWLKKYLNLR